MKLTRVKPYTIKTDPPNLGGIIWFFLKLETDEGIFGACVQTDRMDTNLFCGQAAQERAANPCAGWEAEYRRRNASD